MNLNEKIIEKLKNVYDPEIPISVYDLGLIYEIKITGKDKDKVEILMTLTSETCPVREYLQETIIDEVEKLEEVLKCNIVFTFDPKWNKELVNKDVLEEMGIDTLEVPKHENNKETLNKDFEENEFDFELCFNCYIDSNELPLLKTYHKGEEKFICKNCLNSFDKK